MLDFLIIGVQKAGTTMLKKNLGKITDINIPNKELHFFDSRYHKGIEWYESHFIKGKINGEKTPNYITNESYIKNIYQNYPHVKIVVIFRNPVTRALSHWNHFDQIFNKSKNWGWEKHNKFLDSIKSNKSILTNGHYTENLKNVYKYFKKENVLVLINEVVKDNMNVEFKKICDFLNVKNTLKNIESVHERKYTNDVLLKEINYLIDYYKNKMEDFYEILGYRVKQWDDFFLTFHQQFNSTYIIKNPRVSQNITCIITCVNYYDFLKITLPFNKNYLKNIIIVTTPDDSKTIEVCMENNIQCVKTNIFYEKSKTWCEWINSKLFCNKCRITLSGCRKIKNNKCFNKAKAINYIMKKYVKTDWVLLLDSDIIVPNYISSMDITNFDKEALYGVPRIVYKTQKDWVNKENEYYDFWKFMGFFQLFNIKSKNFSKNYYGYDEDFNYADGSDYHFSRKFYKKHLLNYYVIHLGEPYVNWEVIITDF